MKTIRAITNRLAHLRQAALHGDYTAQNAEKGGPCVIQMIQEGW